MGVAEERLILVEFNPDFCRLLRKRFPKATIIEGDAYGLQKTLGPLAEPASAIVSSLPLFTRPETQRLALLHAGFEVLRPMRLLSSSPTPPYRRCRSATAISMWKSARASGSTCHRRGCGSIAPANGIELSE